VDIHPEFFKTLPEITLHDPLAMLLGAAKEGMLTYTYADAVKLAGHSCPTVAGAFLMARFGLDTLFPGQNKERGSIAVTLRGARHEGVNGVIGSVIGMITGAAAEEGFKGIGALHARASLLTFDPDQKEPVRMRRIDTGEGVALTYDPGQAKTVPIDVQLKSDALGGDADAMMRFGLLWQEQVRCIFEAASECVVCHSKKEIRWMHRLLRATVQICCVFSLSIAMRSIMSVFDGM